MRDRFRDGRILERCSRDIHHLLLPSDEPEADDLGPDVVRLWDGGSRTVAGGTSWDGEVDW
ncbi:MAG: hypothetical protein J7503_10375 [Cellulomonas iranensis]|uniref:hypothetical protein n=1 Tax=Cellulomonas iranensis TaxID=76862 RepID=UPI001B05A4D4|nr:hypothetical protein [Cellulomonas iranensis]MBO9569220.1 hypothetical protein [Cellulomonas iranensis]